MKEKIQKFFYGRQGMDELSKALFWFGLVFIIIAGLIGIFINSFIASFIRWIGLFMLIYSFTRAFSRRLTQRDAENYLYLCWLQRRKHSFEAYKERRRQRKDFKFFKCPGCGKMLRVPRGKGKIHIKCSCGYTLYRKT